MAISAMKLNFKKNDATKSYNRISAGDLYNIGNPPHLSFMNGDDEACVVAASVDLSDELNYKKDNTTYHCVSVTPTLKVYYTLQIQNVPYQGTTNVLTVTKVETDISLSNDLLIFVNYAGGAYTKIGTLSKHTYSLSLSYNRTDRGSNSYNILIKTDTVKKSFTFHFKFQFIKPLNLNAYVFFYDRKLYNNSQLTPLPSPNQSIKVRVTSIPITLIPVISPKETMLVSGQSSVSGELFVYPVSSPVAMKIVVFYNDGSGDDEISSQYWAAIPWSGEQEWNITFNAKTDGDATVGTLVPPAVSSPDTKVLSLTIPSDYY